MAAFWPAKAHPVCSAGRDGPEGVPALLPEPFRAVCLHPDIPPQVTPKTGQQGEQTAHGVHQEAVFPPRRGLRPVRFMRRGGTQWSGWLRGMNRPLCIPMCGSDVQGCVLSGPVCVWSAPRGFDAAARSVWRCSSPLVAGRADLACPRPGVPRTAGTRTIARRREGPVKNGRFSR